MSFEIQADMITFSEEGQTKDLYQSSIGMLLLAIVLGGIGVFVSQFNIILRRRSTEIELHVLLYIFAGLSLLGFAMFLVAAIKNEEKLYTFSSDGVKVTLLEDQSEVSHYSDLVSAKKEMTVTVDTKSQTLILTHLSYTFVDKNGTFTITPRVNTEDIIPNSESFDLFIQQTYNIPVEVLQKTITPNK